MKIQLPVLPGGRRHGHFPQMWQLKKICGHGKIVAVGSVANSWQNFSARSINEFGRWQKNSAPYKIFSQMLLLLSSTHYFS
jgi:hypothetical protein